MICKLLFAFSSHRASRNTLQRKKRCRSEPPSAWAAFLCARVAERQLDLAVNNACGGLAGWCGVHLLSLQTVSGITGRLQGQTVECNPIQPLAHSLMRGNLNVWVRKRVATTEACRYRNKLCFLVQLQWWGVDGWVMLWLFLWRVWSQWCPNIFGYVFYLPVPVVNYPGVSVENTPQEPG